MTIGDGAAKFGKNWDTGQTGEGIFVTALASDERTRDLPVFTSLPGDLEGQLETDLDVCLVVGKVMFLIDVKLWSSASLLGKAFYWTMPLTGWPMKGFLPLLKHRKNGELRLSKNMLIVKRTYIPAFREHDPDLLFVPIVVFVGPGGGNGPNARGMNFPGKIPSYSLDEALALIAQTAEAESGEPLPRVLQELAKLAGMASDDDVDYSVRRALPSRATAAYN